MTVRLIGGRLPGEPIQPGGAEIEPYATQQQVRCG